MGIHTGLVEYRLGDYHGQPLNRVARLESAGHGGQILVSLATQQLLRDGLPNGLTLRDLGDYRLKDLTHPEHVYQVVAADLPDVTTPLVIERLLRDPPKPEPSSAPLISASPELEDDSRCILTIDNTGRRAIIGATLRLVQFDSSYISTDGLPGAWRAVVHDRGRPPMESDPFCMTMDYGTVGIVEVCAVHKAVARFPVPRRDGGRVSAAPSGHLEVGLSDGGIATVEAALHLDPGYGGAQAIPLDESQSRYLLYSRRFTITRDREGEVRWGTE
jgi:hypothetical protein